MSNIRRVELKIDVSASVPLAGPLEIAATAWLPDPAKLATPPVVMFASPGGGYTRGYFDLKFEGRSGYSEAEYHAARGFIYVAYDHLCVGESSIKHQDALTVEMLADANHAMVGEILARLAAGKLDAGYPAVKKPFTIGTGQSMGAGVTIVMQGRRATFDAVGILGVSGLHTVVPQPTTAGTQRSRDTFMFGRTTPVKELSLPGSSGGIGDYSYPFHFDDVPKDILEADMKGGYPMRKTAPYFGSMTIPLCAVGMNSPAYFSSDAARIKVPVFIGVGERDVCPNPWEEPSAYWNSRDVSVYVVPKMAHMHNFASTRDLLWRRLDQWGRMVAGDQPELAS